MWVQASRRAASQYTRLPNYPNASALTATRVGRFFPSQSFGCGTCHSKSSAISAFRSFFPVFCRRRFQRLRFADNLCRYIFLPSIFCRTPFSGQKLCAAVRANEFEPHRPAQPNGEGTEKRGDRKMNLRGHGRARAKEKPGRCFRRSFVGVVRGAGEKGLAGNRDVRHARGMPGAPPSGRVLAAHVARRLRSARANHCRRSHARLSGGGRHFAVGRFSTRRTAASGGAASGAGCR